MRADPRLLVILDAYTGNKGDDPSGDGWVVAILAARGPQGRRQYKVRWTVDPRVPIKEAEEWMLRRQLVPGAQAMADAFERRDDEDSSDDDEGDGPVPAVDSEPSQADPVLGGVGGRGAKRSALQWDPSSGRPRLSLRRSIANYTMSLDAGARVQALIEWTINRQWALRSRVPPAPGQPGAPTQSELDQAGVDLFEIDSKALTTAFKRERQQERRDRAADGEAEGGEEEEDEEDDEDAALASWRAARETELRDEAIARWAQTRREDAGDLATLANQLAALKAVRAAGGDPADVDVDSMGDDEAETLVRAWQAAGDEWPAQLARPRLKLPKIRDFLMPNRSAQARGWLKLQRDVHSQATPQQRRDGVYGSAYGPSWPAAPSATSTPADHVTPVRSYEGGTKLLIECGEPAQTPAVVLSTLEQNSAKSDDSLSLFSVAGEASRAGQGVYAPRGVSEDKKAMLAKTVAWVWALYPLISDKKRSIGIGAYARSTGCAVYGRAWETGPFKQLTRLRATGFERRVQLLSLGMARWQCGNPLVFDAGLLDGDAEALLLDRFKGVDALPRLVDAALQAGVAAPPR